MIADVPFGTFLSGGIDSSMVTAAAQSISSKPIKTFSIGIKDSKFNEAEFAKKISTHLKTEHYEYQVTEQDALALVDQMINAYDEPFADSSSIPTMLVSKMARQEVTMTLSGDGGDELFQGYGMYNWAMRLNNPLLQANRHWIALLMKQLPTRYQRAADVIKYPSRDTLPSHLFSQEQYLFSDKELQSLLLETPNESNPIQHKFSTKRALNPAEEQALFDMHYYLKDDLLTKVDRASMQFSLETRTPFLDYRLVEFALNLPYEFKVQKGISKYILKEVLYDFIPASYFDRPKWGFSIPMDKWLKTDLRPMVDKYLS
jgi:asparagine synthase (glutamine-hydrolysing)